MERRRTRKPPPDYFSRAVQQRLLVLVGMLLLVLIMMQYAARPETWSWMWQNERGSGITDDEATARLDDPPSNSTWLPGLDRALLADIKDDTYFHSQEHDAWFQLLRLVRDTPMEELQRHSLGNASFLQIYRQTKSYRGRIVEIAGTIRRAHRLTAPKNDVGIESYWQCWMFPEGSRRPIVVYALQLPGTIAPGMHLAHEAAVIGFVYKRWTYQSGEELTVAPVVVARQPMLTVAERQHDTEDDSVSPPAGLILAGAFSAALLTSLLLYRFTATRSNANRVSDAAIQFPGDSDQP